MSLAPPSPAPSTARGKPWPEVTALGLVVVLLLADVGFGSATASVLHVALELAAASLLLGLAGRLWFGADPRRV